MILFIRLRCMVFVMDIFFSVFVFRMLVIGFVFSVGLD